MPSAGWSPSCPSTHQAFRQIPGKTRRDGVQQKRVMQQRVIEGRIGDTPDKYNAYAVRVGHQPPSHDGEWRFARSQRDYPQAVRISRQLKGVGPTPGWGRADLSQRCTRQGGIPRMSPQHRIARLSVKQVASARGLVVLVQVRDGVLPR